MMTCLHSRIFHSTENIALLNGLLFCTVTFAFRATYVCGKARGMVGELDLRNYAQAE